MTLRVGEVRVPEDKDFDYFKSLCMNDENWKVAYDKKETQVLTKGTANSTIQMCKVKTTFEGLAPAVLYDVLHDEEYRKEWDKNMVEGFQICYINPNNDICYYSVKVVTPIKTRDFVMHRSWLAFPGDEFMIFNHSVFHAKQPPRKNAVRGVSLLTGYYLRPVPNKPNSTSFIYLTQCDPRGKLPTWAINKSTQMFAPRIARRLYKIALKYPQWKAKHNPDYKPWVYPEQIKAPRIDWSDIQKEEALSDVVDESNLNEEAANGNSEQDDD